MLLLADGTHFTFKTTAATKSVMASHPMWLNLLHPIHLQVQRPIQVFLDSVTQQIVARPPVRPPVQQVRQQNPVKQTVRWQRSLDAISSQLSALPPPVERWTISPPVNR